jgi:hypothetical protein
MANLSALTLDRDAVRHGDWVEVGAGENVFEIRTRGITQAYRDGLNRLRLTAVRELNRNNKPGQPFYTPELLPPSVDDRCIGQALAEHCVIDVRGLYDGKDENGQPRSVTVDEFRELLRDPEGRSILVSWTMQAAGSVGQARQEERKEAEGNS